MNLRRDFLSHIISDLKKEGLLTEKNEVYKMTEKGREYMINSYEEIVQSFNEEYTGKHYAL